MGPLSALSVPPGPEPSEIQGTKAETPKDLLGPQKSFSSTPPPPQPAERWPRLLARA